MSDQSVLHCIEVIEDLLNSDPESLNVEMLTGWNERFGVYVQGAEHGSQWPAIVQKADLVSGRIKLLLEDLVSQKETLKQELLGQAQAHRALKAYGTVG